MLAVALPRITPSAATGGAEGEPVAGLERDAGRLQQLRRAAVAPRQDGFVDRARLAATQAPGRILGAVAIHVRNALLQCAVGEIDAEPAAVLAGAPGIGAQREALDQERILNLLQLDRGAAHVALADRDRSGFAILVRPPTPPAAENVHQQEAPPVRPKAPDGAAPHVALVRGGDALGQSLRQGLEDGVDHGRKRDAPKAERRRPPGVEDLALGQDEVERAKRAFVHRRFALGQILESDARRSEPARIARIGRARHLVVDLREIDHHALAVDHHLDLDAKLAVEIAAVIVEKAFRLVSPVRNFRDEGAHRAVGRVPNRLNAGFDGTAPIARDELVEAAHAELATGDLRTQIAQGGLGKAQIVVDHLPERVVALAGVVDLERAQLQSFLIDLRGLDRAETLAHAADVDPVGAARGERHHFARVEAGRIDHDVVEMLPAYEAVVHDDDVAGREAVETIALDAVLHRDAEVGEEDR